MLKSIDLMQQHTFDALIQEEEQRFNKSKKEEVIPIRYNLLHLLIIEMVKRMKSLNKELKILNHQFIISLNKKLQLKVLECLEELS